MFKKILVAGIFALPVTFTSFAAGSGYSPAGDTTDIVIKKDTISIQSVKLDPKQGFKDLFVNTSEVNGVSAEHLNPRAVKFVEDYMAKHTSSMTEMKSWGKPYFDMMDAILEQHGLPKEMKYLAVIESQLKSNARSWAGAVGPWQFMPATARNMGLKVTRKVDERRDLYKSSHAAAKYLSNLFDLYGDWLLVIAAYNSGPGTVNGAIKRSGSRDFWTLQNFLPLESRNHVKKFIATHYIMEGEGGVTTLTKTEVAAHLLNQNATGGTAVDPGGNSKTLSVSGRYNSLVMTRHLEMDLASFHKFNPNFDRQIADFGKYELTLPTDKMELFAAKKQDILNESLQVLLNPVYASQSIK